MLKSEKILVQKNFWAKNLGPKKLRSKKLGPEILGLHNFGSVKFRLKKFWSNKILVKTEFGSKACKKFGSNSFVKIGTVTAEIFLLWANVARTNVAWTIVTVKVGIC